jgi:hypothetical protein
LIFIGDEQGIQRRQNQDRSYSVKRQEAGKGFDAPKALGRQSLGGVVIIAIIVGHASTAHTDGPRGLSVFNWWS